jgi:hypothetical protein
MDRHIPLRHHATDPMRGASSLSEALPGDLQALRWLTALTWSGGVEVVELLLQVTHTADRWGQSPHPCEARLRLRDGRVGCLLPH